MVIIMVVQKQTIGMKCLTVEGKICDSADYAGCTYCEFTFESECTGHCGGCSNFYDCHDIF